MAANPVPELPSIGMTDGVSPESEHFRDYAHSHGMEICSTHLGATTCFEPKSRAGQSHMAARCPLSPSIWRNLSSSVRLTSRLFRDGFHALAVLPSGHIVGAVPGAIVTFAPGETEFRVSHKVLRGTRPLHITATPGRAHLLGRIFRQSSAR